MRKNKKIDANDLYIGKLIKYELYKKEEHGDIVDKWYRPVIFDPPVYIIVRDGGYGYARDIFNNTKFPIFESPYINGNGISVSLEFPIPAQFGSKIRYKDAENILKAYKNIVFEKRAKECEDNVSEEATKLYKDNVSDGSTKLLENDISKVKKR